MSAISHVPEEIPSPLDYPELCGRNADGAGRSGAVRSAICDIDGILSTHDKNVMEGHINRLNSVEDETFEVGVCIIEAMNPHFVSGAGGVESAGEKFARRLHDKWGVGNAGSDNGALVFLSVHDRNVFISRGAGLASKLTPSTLDQIISNMKPYLRKGDYGKALQGSVVEISLVLTGQSLPTRGGRSDANNGDEGDLGGSFIVCVIFLILAGIVIVVSSMMKRNESDNLNDLERGRTRLERLTREVSAANASNSDAAVEETTPHFPSTSCPICLEDFPAANSTSGDASDMPSSRPSAEAAASAADPSSSMSGADARRAMELRCGHQFCLKCLEEYLKGPQGTKCPICREPVDPSDPAPPSSRGQRGRAPRRHQHQSDSFNNENGTSCTGSISRSHQPEIRYRLQRLRSLYPQVMNADTFQSLDAAVGNGQEASSIVSQLNDRAAIVSQTISSRRVQAEMARSGGGGSTIGRSRSRVGGSSGFGGGSSSGGSGGRW